MARFVVKRALSLLHDLILLSYCVKIDLRGVRCETRSFFYFKIFQNNY